MNYKNEIQAYIENKNFQKLHRFLINEIVKKKADGELELTPDVIDGLDFFKQFVLENVYKNYFADGFDVSNFDIEYYAFVKQSIPSTYCLFNDAGLLKYLLPNKPNLEDKVEVNKFNIILTEIFINIVERNMHLHEDFLENEEEQMQKSYKEFVKTITKEYNNETVTEYLSSLLSFMNITIEDYYNRLLTEINDDSLHLDIGEQAHKKVDYYAEKIYEGFGKSKKFDFFTTYFQIV